MRDTLNRRSFLLGAAPAAAMTAATLAHGTVFAHAAAPFAQAAAPFAQAAAPPQPITDQTVYLAGRCSAGVATGLHGCVDGSAGEASRQGGYLP